MSYQNTTPFVGVSWLDYPHTDPAVRLPDRAPRQGGSRYKNTTLTVTLIIHKITIIYSMLVFGTRFGPGSDWTCDEVAGWHRQQLVNSFEDICRPGLCLSMSEPGVTNIFTSSKTSWVTLWGGYQKKERKHSCTNHSCSAVDYQ